MNWLPLSWLLMLPLACMEPETCPTWYADVDADGYGDPFDGVASCAELPGRATLSGDCNDHDAGVHPAATDVPGDGRDQDCDGEDACAGAERVTQASACGDHPIILTELARSVPSGGCLCASTADLSVPSDTPESDLAQLHSVAGSLTLWTRESDLTLPVLQQVGTLDARMDGNSLRAPALREADAVVLRDPADVDLSGLETCQSVEISAPAGHIDMSSLAETESATLSSALNLLGWELPVGAHFQHLLLASSNDNGLPGAGLRVDTLEVLAPVDPAWDLDWQVDTLQVGALERDFEFAGLTALALLEPGKLGGLSLRLPDLQTLEQLTQTETGTLELDGLLWLGAALIEGTLHAPALTEAGTIDLDWYATLDAPALRSVEHIRGSYELELPALEQADTLSAGRGSFPELWRVSTLIGGLGWETTAPKLVVVERLLVGQVQAPSLVSLPAGQLNARAGDLDSLRWVDGELLLEDRAELPALRGVGGAFELSDVQALSAPELQAVDAIRVEGSAPTQLPDPTPAGVRAVEFMPRDPVQWGSIQGGLYVECSAHRCSPPELQVTQVQGNLSVEGASWTTLGSFHVGRVEGDLRYCLPAVPTSELDAWLDTIEIHGTVEDTCK